MTDSFSTHTTFEVDGKPYKIANLAKLGEKFDILNACPTR